MYSDAPPAAATDVPPSSLIDILPPDVLAHLIFKFFNDKAPLRLLERKLKKLIDSETVSLTWLMRG